VRGLGIVCSIKNRRPVVSGIVLERTADGATFVDRFELVADRREDFPQQLATLLDDLQSRFAATEKDDWPDAVVVRAMDFYRGRSNLGDTAQKRYAAEGVVLAAARSRVSRTVWLTGLEVGNKCGLSKDAAEARGLEIVPNGPKEAAAAALAALRLAAG
jgi:hypothetical protein